MTGTIALAAALVVAVAVVVGVIYREKVKSFFVNTYAIVRARLRGQEIVTKKEYHKNYSRHRVEKD